MKLGGDVPTIAFRDLAIQRRENDLVGGSFGRGIFVLDDYSALRELGEDGLAKEAALFPRAQGARGTSSATRSARRGKASQGAAVLHGRQPAVRRGLHLPPRRGDKEPGEAAAGGGEAARRGGQGHAVPRLGRRRGRAARAEPAVAAHRPRRGGRGRAARRRARRPRASTASPGTCACPPTPAIGASPRRAARRGRSAPAGVLAAAGPLQRHAREAGRRATTRARRRRCRSRSRRCARARCPAPTRRRRRRSSRALAGRAARDERRRRRRCARRLRASTRCARPLDRSRTAPDGLDADLHAIEQELYAVDEALAGNRSRGADRGRRPATVHRRVQVAALAAALVRPTARRRPTGAASRSPRRSSRRCASG